MSQSLNNWCYSNTAQVKLKSKNIDTRQRGITVYDEVPRAHISAAVTRVEQRTSLVET